MNAYLPYLRLSRKRSRSVAIAARRLRSALTAALCVVGLCGCPAAPDRAQFQFDRGLAFYRNSDYERAIAAFTEAIRQQPKHAQAYYERGLSHVQLGAFDAAIADYTQAIRIRPDFRQAYNNRGVAYAQKEDYANAVADCTKAIALDPNDELAYRNRALAYHDLGQFDKAIEDCTAAIRINPASAETYLQRGNARLDRGDYQKAIADFDEAIHLNAERSKAYFGRAVAHSKLGHAAEAAADFRKAKRLNSAFDIPREYLDLDGGVASPPVALGKEGSEQAAIDRHAIAMAKRHYESLGYAVEDTSQTQPYELRCSKGQDAIIVEVKATSGTGDSLHLTPREAAIALDPAVRVDLFVVGDIETTPTTSGFATSGGRVIQQISDWTPEQAELAPTAFEYHLGSKAKATPQE